MQTSVTDGTLHSPSLLQKDKDEFFKDFLKSLNFMRQTQQFIDVIITAQNEIFAAHKLILSIHSSYFSQIFQENSGLNNVSFNVSSYGVRILLDYFYTGQIKITQGNFNAVLKAAGLFKVERVLNLCYDFEKHSRIGIKTESADVIQDNEPTTSMTVDNENTSYHDEDDDDDNNSDVSSGILKENSSVYQSSALRKRYFNSSSINRKCKFLKVEINSSSKCDSPSKEYQSLSDHSSYQLHNHQVDTCNNDDKSTFVIPHIAAITSYASVKDMKNVDSLVVIESSTAISSKLPQNSSFLSTPVASYLNDVCKVSNFEKVSSTKDKVSSQSVEIKSEPDSPESKSNFINNDNEKEVLTFYSQSERSNSVISQSSQNHSVLSSGDCISSKNSDVSPSFVPVDVEIREDQNTNSSGCFDYFPLNSLENLVTDDFFKSNISNNCTSNKGLNLIINNIPVSVVLSSKPKAYVCGICGEHGIGLHAITNHIQTVHKSVSQHSAQSSSNNELFLSKVKIDVTDILDNSRPQTQNHPPKAIPSGASITCETCGLVFDYLWDLFKHQDQVHKVKSALSCDTCPYIGNNERNLHFHRYSVHGVSLPLEWEKKAQRCPYCPHIARAPSMLKSHINRKHLDEQNNIANDCICQHCGARFPYAASLSKHLKKHTEEIVSD